LTLLSPFTWFEFLSLSGLVKFDSFGVRIGEFSIMNDDGTGQDAVMRGNINANTGKRFRAFICARDCDLIQVLCVVSGQGKFNSPILQFFGDRLDQHMFQ
jgi:hypothetical protein